jgi:hypothetical protein
MSKGEIVADGTPEEVFYDNFDTLSALSLRPPTVVDFCRRLHACGVPQFLTVDQLTDYIDAARKTGTEGFTTERRRLGS